MMKLVVLESPFAADTEEGLDANVEYARACIRDCLMRGEAPIASHLLFTQPGILQDNNAHERALGMKAGLSWVPASDGTVVYVDRGISKGMRSGVLMALKYEKPVELRSIAGVISPEQLAEYQKTIGIPAP